MKPVVKDHFSPTESVLVHCSDGGPSLTKQSEAAECDINLIVKRYERTGVLPPMREGQFVDVSEVGSYAEAIAQVREAEALFYQLPPQLRAEFDNDAAAFLDGMQDPDLVASLRERGLLPELEEPAAEPAVVPQRRAKDGGPKPAAVESPPAGETSGA